MKDRRPAAVPAKLPLLIQCPRPRGIFGIFFIFDGMGHLSAMQGINHIDKQRKVPGVFLEISRIGLYLKCVFFKVAP